MIAQDMMMDERKRSTSKAFDNIADLQTLWNVVDRDMSGDASTEELIDTLVAQGYAISEDEVGQLMSRM
eukprot:scaffold464094_cov43-Prasinocladus_malaysianus.AAC.1